MLYSDVMVGSLPLKQSDTVSLVCALLLRYPEIASMRSAPGEGTVRFSFAVQTRLDEQVQHAIIADIESHVAAFLLLFGQNGEVRIECESDRLFSFIHVTRDLDTFTKDELAMLSKLFGERFGALLVRNGTTQQQHSADDAAPHEDLVESAIDALRDSAQFKSLVGFWEGQRVLVYFLKSQKKTRP